MRSPDNKAIPYDLVERIVVALVERMRGVEQSLPTLRDVGGRVSDLDEFLAGRATLDDRYLVGPYGQCLRDRPCGRRSCGSVDYAGSHADLQAGLVAPGV